MPKAAASSSSSTAALSSKAPPPPRRQRGQIGQIIIKDLDGRGEEIIPIDITKRPPVNAGAGSGWRAGAPWGTPALTGRECWVCGGEHRRSDCPNKLEVGGGHLIQRKLICLGCRQRGHLLRDCPSAGAAALGAGASGICFNCGAPSSDHSLRDCPVPRAPGGALPFAACFVCGGGGHIARDCPRGRGVFPRGGECKRCGSTRHTAAECERAAAATAAVETSAPAAARIRTNAHAAARAPATRGAEDDVGGNVGTTFADDEAAAKPKQRSTKAFYRKR